MNAWCEMVWHIISASLDEFVVPSLLTAHADSVTFGIGW